MARAAAPNLFTTAKVVVSKATAKKAVETIECKELELYAAIDHSIKWLASVLETVKAGIITEIVAPKFVADGTKIEKKPDNFNAEEGKATANIQAKKRASNSAFTDIELEILEEYKVPTATSGGQYIINPDHSEWLEKNSDKLSAALIKAGAPINLFERLPTKVIAADDSIDFIFKNKFQSDVIAKLLPIVTTFAIKPKFDTADEEANEKALAVISKLLAPEED